jgi:hypothetical protein
MKKKQPAESFWVCHALCAAYLRPKDKNATSVREQIEKWIDDCEPVITPKEALKILQQERGTPLEPFVVPEYLIPLCIATIRLATSRQADLPRMRLVSSTALQDKGGLFITRNLKTFYGESFSFSKRPRPLASVPYLLLNRVPTTYAEIKPQSEHFLSTFILKKTGATISIPKPARLAAIHSKTKGEKFEIQTDAVNFLKRHTSFSGMRDGIGALGLRIEINQKAMLIQSGDPASLMRLNSLMNNHSVLNIPSPDGALSMVPLSPAKPGEEITAFFSLYFPEGLNLPWMRMPITISPPLDKGAQDYLNSLICNDVQPLLN